MRKRFPLVLVALLLLAALCPTAALGARILRVGWYYADTDESHPDAARSYYKEYLQVLSQYTGWTYEYKNGTWEECLRWLENGEIDLLGFVQETEERKSLFGYPALPMATTSGCLVAGENSELNETSLLTQTGLTVGLFKGNAFNAAFETYRAENGLSVNCVEYASISDMSPALAAGDIDMALLAEEDIADGERVITRVDTANQYFVTDIDDQALLRELNSAMTQVNAYCSCLNSDLYQKYFNVRSNGKPAFTQDERQFIEQNPAILVLYDSGWPPVEYLDTESGAYKGISPDLFALLSEKCGIQFVYEGSTSGAVLEELQSGDQRNVLTTISYDYAWADRHGVNITQPFITSGIVKLGRRFDAPDAVAAINEKAFFTYLLADELAGVQTKSYSKQAERLEAVRTGAADYTFVTEDQANYYRSIPRYADLDVERMVGYQQSICISVEKDCDPELMSIISKALASISHDEMTEIVTRNTINAYQLTFSDKLYQNRYVIGIVAVVALIIIASLVVIERTKRKSVERIKSAYKQKEEALLAAQQASAAKGSFMSRMSHEIRTPLNAVIGYNTIARSALSEAASDTERKQAEMKVMDCLTKSDIASKHLLTIINDVLDMSAIESGKITVAHDRFDFKGLITSLTTVFYSQASAKGVEYEVVFDTATEEWFVGDQMRTNQILTNLISNAVKFTPEGGMVKVSISQTAETDTTADVRFEVSDTGIGMEQEYLTHLWTPFEQADSSISRRFGGTGLGLSITKSLVDLLGGTIAVDSKPGEGSTFTVKLRFDKTMQPESDGATDFSAINALVVDDDQSTCEYIRLLFNRCGARCATVTSGMDAIESYAQAEKRGDPFTMCLIDWRMPKMDGIETIKRIREMHGNDLPIIVLTAYDFSELMDKAAEVGVNMFLSKPLFQSSLFNLLANISGAKPKGTVQRNQQYHF